MVQQRSAEPLHIGDSLVSVRAAIEVVAGGGATRITVHAVDATQILPAARVIARAAGVRIEPAWSPDDAGVDLVVTPGDDATDE